MGSKKQYYELDEIGFVGTQDKRTNAQVKMDIKKTIQFLKDKKSDKAIAIHKTSRRSLSRAK